MSRTPRNRAVIEALFGAVAAIAAAALLAPVLFRGWYPHDEGAIGQAAERILRGEVPHRDFDEIYTGLLSYWHAAAFQLGGIASTTLRLPLFVVTLAWVVTLYRLALRVVPAWSAALLAVLCLVWAVPNYPAPMPSWYNLFLATFGALALVRWRETGATRWLASAGALGGLSFLVKLTGLVFLIGGGLAIVFATHAPEEAEDRRSRGGALFIAAGIALVLMVLWIPFARAGMRELARLWVPIAIVGGALVVREFRAGSALLPRVRRTVEALMPFVAGAMIPVLLWGIAMLAMGALEPMLQGVFVVPFRRVASASVQPPALDALLGTAIVALLLIPRRSARVSWILTASIVVLGGWALMSSYNTYIWYRTLWQTAWGLPLLAAAWGAGAIMQSPVSDEHRRRRDVAVILTCVAVAALLVEFPFAAPIYTIYALPLAILAVAALARSLPSAAAPDAAPGLAIAVLLLAFGVMRLLPGSVSTLGYRFAVSQETHRLEIPRSGLLVTKEDASRYAALVGTLQELAPGRTLWAGPDAPEVYFLSGAPNRTRVMFDFLDADPDASRSLADRVSLSEASLVVIKTSPSFSTPASAADLATLRARFPSERTVPGFLVFWR